jgi:hypothetical protein
VCFAWRKDCFFPGRQKVQQVFGLRSGEDFQPYVLAELFRLPSFPPAESDQGVHHQPRDNDKDNGGDAEYDIKRAENISGLLRCRFQNRCKRIHFLSPLRQVIRICFQALKKLGKIIVVFRGKLNPNK